MSMRPISRKVAIQLVNAVMCIAFGLLLFERTTRHSAIFPDWIAQSGMLNILLALIGASILFCGYLLFRIGDDQQGD